MKNFLLMLLSGLWLIAPNVFAWDSTGHRLVAEIAYDHLTFNAKKEIDKITQTLDKGYPPQSRFLYGATWPDQLRAQNITRFNNWHFINYAFSDDHTPLLPYQSENVVWAIGWSEQALRNPHLNRRDKAFFLRFLVHCVGDVHEPLHCANRYSHAFPQGDISGNLIPLQNVDAQNLHAYWDEGLGLFRQNASAYPLRSRELRQLADKIEEDYPLRSLGDKLYDPNPTDWAQESFHLAQSFAYPIPANTQPSTTYTHEGQEIAEQQIALAGYRLAYLLNTMYRAN